jgi:hypothetical protein
MGLVLAFLIGYTVGGKGGRNNLDEIVASAKLIMASDEFRDFVALLRTHVGAALTDLGTVVATAPASAVSESILEKVQGLMAASGRPRPTSPGS